MQSTSYKWPSSFDISYPSLPEDCSEFSELDNFCVINGPITIPNISQLKYEFTEPIMIYGAMCAAQLIRKNDALHIYIHFKKMEWEQVAAVKITLYSYNDSPSIVQYIHPNIYDKNTGWGCYLVEWNELFSSTLEYVRDDSINFNVEITSANPHRRDKSKLICENMINEPVDNDRGWAKYRMTVLNFKNLLAVRSPQIPMRNQNFYIKFYKNNEDKIMAYISIHRDNNETDSMICNLFAKIKLFSCVPKLSKCMKIDKVLEHGIEFELMPTDCALPVDLFYAKHDKMIVEIELKVSQMMPYSLQNVKLIKYNTLQVFTPIAIEYCLICRNTAAYRKIKALACSHTFCFECLNDMTTVRDHCPKCRGDFRWIKTSKITFLL